MEAELLKSYARLIAVSGANVQPGQAVYLYCDVGVSDFAALVTEACYQAGAGRVVTLWSDQKQTMLHYRYQSLETLSQVYAPE